MSKIILINGTSGSGKSTTAQQFLDSRNDVWAYVNQDDIRQLIKSGRESADDLYETWNKNTKKQWVVSIPICVDLAKRYYEYGINCMIDFYCTVEDFEVWKKYLSGLHYSLIILMLTKEIVLERNRHREYPLKLSDNKVLQTFEEFQSWRSYENAKIIDNSLGSPAITVKLIQDHLLAI